MSNIINGYTSLEVADFSWYNQGAATATDSVNGINLYSPANSPNGYTYKSLLKTVPTAPYKAIANIKYIGPWQPYVCWGMALADNDGKSANFSNQTRDTDPGVGRMQVIYMSNETTYGDRWDSTDIYPNIEWFMLEDDGTNRNSYASWDGVNWSLIRTESRTNYLTPTKIGVCVCPYSINTYVTVNSFKIITAG